HFGIHPVRQNCHSTPDNRVWRKLTHARTGTHVSVTYRTERDRGIKEYRELLAELRKKWPLAFPVRDQDVQPLAAEATYEIAAVMGWSYPYTLGVLSRWKMARCTARRCSAITNASLLTALQPKWWRLRREAWRPSTLRGARRAGPRRKQQRVRPP